MPVDTLYDVTPHFLGEFRSWLDKEGYGRSLAASLMPGSPATTLPATPADKQQAILTDSTTAPTYGWLLQWSAAAANWMFLGGSYQSAEVDASESRNNVAYGDCATVHSATLIRPGVYDMEYGFEGQIDTATNNQQWMSPKFSAAEAVDADAARLVNGNLTTTPILAASRQRRITVAATGQVVTMRYRQGAASLTSPVERRWLKIKPFTLT